MKKDGKKGFFGCIALSVLGMTGLSLYILADTFFISLAFGENGLAALNFAIPVYSLISGIGLMAGIGGGTRFSLLLGNAEKRKAVFTDTVYLGGAIALILFLAGLLLPERIAALLGASGEAFPLTSDYLRIILLFAPCFIANNIVLAFLRNDNAPGRAMAGMLAGSGANILLDYVFMFPLGMGMTGAAIATALAPIISLAVMSPHFIRKRNGFSLIKKLPSFGSCMKICGAGISAFVVECSSGLSLAVFNIVILGIAGDTGVAAYGIIANITLVVIALFTGIAQGAQPLVSAAYGEGNGAKAARLMKLSALTALFAAAASYALLNIFGEGTAAVFGADGGDFTALVTGGFLICFTAFFPAGFNLTAAAYLSAAGKPRFAFAVTLIRALAVIPLALLLPKIPFFGGAGNLSGVWLSLPLAETLAALLAATFLARFGAEKTLT